jgi:hypothetical protein
MSATFTEAMIIAELGDPDGVLATQLPAFWQAHSTPGRSNYLVYLYTKRSGITILMGTRRDEADYDIHAEHSERLSGRAKNLSDMYAQVDAEIARQEKIVSSLGVASGVLTTTAPEPPPNAWGADRNASKFLGNPYGRFRQ